MFLMSKAKSLQSEEQMTHHQKNQRPGTGRVAAHHVHHSFPCAPARRTGKRHVFHTSAKTGKTDNRQWHSLGFAAAQVSKI